MQRLHNPVKCTFFFWRILTDKIFKTSCVCLYGFTFHIVQFVIINYLLKKTHRTQMCKCALSLKITSATKWQLLKMCHLRHRLRIFLFCRKNMFRSQDIQVFVFLTIPWFTKLATSRWVLVHEIGCISKYIFWITNHEVTKLGQLIDISKYNNFQ